MYGFASIYARGVDQIVRKVTTITNMWLMLLAATLLAATRPWRSRDDGWFHESALLAAVLAGAMLIAIL